MSENKPFRARKFFQERQAGTIFDFFGSCPTERPKKHFLNKTYIFSSFLRSKIKVKTLLALTCCVKGLFNGAADTGSQ